jgi:hypothetical protein
MSIGLIGIIISLTSLAVSATTAWLTLLRRGAIKMIRPSLIAFMDAGGVDGPKVWFRSMLYATAIKGNVVESMFVRLRRGEAQQNFSFWVCGERGKLASGCGLYVGHDGVALDHHFVLPKDGSRFDFLAGDYVVEVFATLPNSGSPRLLAKIPLHLTEEHAKALKSADKGVYFDWWPDSARYNAHVVQHPERREASDALVTILTGKLPS